jgi:hypothetical protein
MFCCASQCRFAELVRTRRKGGNGQQVRGCSPRNCPNPFSTPLWPAEQIGIVSSQGAQLASDATVYHELQSQAAKLGADAVLIVSSGMRQYAAMPGFATYNAFGGSNLYGNLNFINGYAQYHATGFAMGPQSAVATSATHSKNRSTTFGYLTEVSLAPRALDA